MSGTTEGVVDFVLKAVEDDGRSKPLIFHCIIHQRSLCDECLDISWIPKPAI